MGRRLDTILGRTPEGPELEGRDFQKLIHRELTAQMDDFASQIPPEYTREFPLREGKHVWYFDEGRRRHVSLQYEYSVSDTFFTDKTHVLKNEKIIGKDPLTGQPRFEYERLTSGKGKQVIFLGARRLPIISEGVGLYPTAAIGPYINFLNPNYPHSAAITGNWGKVQVYDRSGNVERIQEVTKQDRADILSIVRLRQRGRGRSTQLRQTAAPR